MYWYEKVVSHWGWMLPKVPIIWKNASNKSWLKLFNFLQETLRTHISESPRNGAREPKRLLFLKYKALEWESKSLEPPGSTTWGDRDIHPLFFLIESLILDYFCLKHFSGTLSSVQPLNEPTSTFQKSIKCCAIIYGITSWFHHSVL